VCTPLIVKFHYTGPTGPDQTKSADFVGDPGLRSGSREKVRAGPCGSGRARVVEFSLYATCMATPLPLNDAAGLQHGAEPTATVL